MYDLKRKIVQKKFMLIAYFLPFLIIVLIYGMFEIFPFGENHILRLDAFHSYAPRVNELILKIKNGESLFYSWRGGLGNDFYFIFITSMINPFLVLGFLFGTRGITEIFSIMYLLQIPLASLTFYGFLKYKFQKDSLYGVVLSSLYALSSFVLAYHFVYYWQPSIILLPIIAIGLERLVNHKKAGLYIFSLGVGIIFNYLMGIFLCFFSVIYYLVNIITKEGEPFLNWLKKTICTYIISSLLAGGIATFVLVPAVLSLGNTSYGAAGSDFPQNMSFYYSIFQILTGSLVDAVPSILQGNSSGIPNIYVGLSSLLLTVLFFIQKNHSKKEKIVYLSVIFLIILICSLNVLNYLVNGLRYPSGLPHRFSFILCFFVVLLAYKAFERIRETKKITIIYTSISVISVVIFMAYLYPQKDLAIPGVIGDQMLLINIFFIVAYSMIFIFIKKINNKAIYILCLLALVEVVGNTKAILKVQMGETLRSSYIIELQEDMKKVTEKVRSNKEFYRAELSPNRTLSDSRLFNYNGISMFSVTYSSVTNLFQLFGVDSGVNRNEYRFCTPLLNAIFGVKYSMNRGSMFDSPPLYFEPTQQHGRIKLYENKKVLPLGFMVNETILSWSSKTEKGFEAQNQFVNLASSVTTPLFDKPVPLNRLIEMQNIIISENDGIYQYQVEPNVTYDSQLSFKAEYIVPESKMTYMSFDLQNMQRIKVQIKNHPEINRHVSSLKNDTLEIGYLEEGTKIVVTFTIKNDLLETGINGKKRIKNNEQPGNILNFLGWPKQQIAKLAEQSGEGKITIAQMNRGVFESVYNSFSQQPLRVLEYNSTKIEGTVLVREDGIMYTSIPYDNRWRVVVNGERIKPVRIMETFLGLELDQGEYEITFEYIPTGVKLSIFTTLLSIALSIYYLSYLHKLKCKNE